MAGVWHGEKQIHASPRQQHIPVSAASAADRLHQKAFVRCDKHAFFLVQWQDSLNRTYEMLTA